MLTVLLKIVLMCYFLLFNFQVAQSVFLDDNNLTQHISKIIVLVFTKGSGTIWLSATQTISSKLVIFKSDCQVAWTPAILFSAILGFPLTSTNRGRYLTRDTQPREIGDGELRFAFIIQLQSLQSFSIFMTFVSKITLFKVLSTYAL